MDPLSLAQAAQFAGAVRQNGADRLLANISTDSRTVQAGDLFVALQGENFDGHKFVEQAMQRGAAGAIVETNWIFPCSGLRTRSSPTNRLRRIIAVR